jgi:hypothetical protein
LAAVPVQGPLYCRVQPLQVLSATKPNLASFLNPALELGASPIANGDRA